MNVDRATGPRSTPRREASVGALDPELFPPSFLRLLSLVPAAVPRLHAGVADGRRAVRGEGGRFLFRGHRAYRPGDDLKRVDWNVAARLGRVVVRQLDPERDLVTEVWLDGSASMGLHGVRVASARLAALAFAIAVAGRGVARLGLLQGGEARPLAEGREPGEVRSALERLSATPPTGRAELAQTLPRVVRRLARGTRFLLVSDLLTRTDPGVLHGLAGRGVRGALAHLRAPEVHAPEPLGAIVAEDAETGESRRVLLDERVAAEVAARAQRHADLWAHHARSVGLRYLPFAPSERSEDVLRRLVLEVP